MRNSYWALLVIALLLVLGVLFTQFNYLFMEKDIFSCDPNDLDCLSKANQYMDDCIPSKFSIEDGNLTLIVDIERNLSECDIREEIEQTGYTVNCTAPIGEGCEGSLFDYMAPEGGGGGGDSGDSGDSGDGEQPTGPPGVPPGWVAPDLYCSLTDIACKSDAVYYVKNCLPATITDDDQRWSSGYWTKYITVGRTDSTCELYFEITNAVDIPPEVPPNLVGMTMECLLPVSSLPIEVLEEGWCTGPLFEYLEI